MARILGLNLDKAQYRPGDDVKVEVVAGAECAGGLGRLSFTVYDVATKVYSSAREAGRFTIPGQILYERLQATGRQNKAVGFGVVVDVQGQERAAAAFDVAPCWSAMPRYGFLCEFDSDDHAGEDKLQAMVNYHLNVVQFYDWMYRHHDLIPPCEVFEDPLGRPLNYGSLRRLISRSRERGMVPVAYGAMYGAGPEYADAHPESVAYTMDGARHSLGGFLTIMDISGHSPWRDHIIGEYGRALSEAGFVGIHIDQYGFPKDYYLCDGAAMRTEAQFGPFIRACRDKLGPDAGLIFNAVNNWPLQETATSPQDAVYIEAWPPHDSYRDLRYLVLNGLKACRHEKQVIIAAYLKAFSEGEDPAGAEIGLRLTTATIMSSGGFHLVLGEGNSVLTDAYYPKYAKLRPEFSGTVRRYWDFAVRHEEYLFDLEARDVSEIEVGGTDDAFHIADHPFGPWGDAGRIRVAIRHGEDYRLLELVNLLGIDSPRWNEAKQAPTPLSHIKVRWLMDRPIKDMLFASADADTAEFTPIAFTHVPHRHGRAVEFSVPLLHYWSIVLARFEEAGC